MLCHFPRLSITRLITKYSYFVVFLLRCCMHLCVSGDLGRLGLPAQRAPQSVFIRASLSLLYPTPSSGDSSLCKTLLPKQLQSLPVWSVALIRTPELLCFHVPYNLRNMPQVIHRVTIKIIYFRFYKTNNLEYNM